MERLTEEAWRNLDPWECCGQDRFCGRGCHDLGGCTNGCIVPKLYARLAAYEDTGLGPEDVKEHEAAYIEIMTRTYGPLRQKISKWMQAEKEGRLVVLPCKKGDTLWSYYDYPTWGISKIAVTAVSTLDGITVINTDNYGEIEEKDIGETVFLTREEAEAALKKEGGGRQ